MIKAKEVEVWYVVTKPFPYDIEDYTNNYGMYLVYFKHECQAKKVRYEKTIKYYKMKAKTYPQKSKYRKRFNRLVFRNIQDMQCLIRDNAEYFI